MTKKLTKSPEKVFCGVCSGIADYFELDPTLVRVAYLIASFFCVGFPGFLLYLILAIVMPSRA